MTDREDAAMDAVEPSASQARGPPLTVDARALELRDRDDAVLARRDSCDRRIRVGLADFCIHVHA
jgi:hypothetical protein